MLILALDSALGGRSVGVVADGALAAGLSLAEGDGPSLPEMAQAVLDRAGAAAGALGLIAVTVGPGRFTGIRAALALAHGIGASTGAPVVGVTVGEAIADAFPRLGRRRLLVATDSRRGRVFLERDGRAEGFALDELPAEREPVAVAGDAAPAVAAWLAGRGGDVMLLDARAPMPRHVALAALARLRGELPVREAQPLYVDPPAASLPAGGLRPPPA
jgi:tRNA threonylcarbamoyl adenosine modification protein YeaZ